MSGEKRYFLDTNALVAFGNGEKTRCVVIGEAVVALFQKRQDCRFTVGPPRT